jgi:hypothetical protein
MHTDDFNYGRPGHNVQMVASETFSGNDGELQRFFCGIRTFLLPSVFGARGAE